MKAFAQSIVLVLALAIPFSTQAGQNTLLDKLNGPWYSSDMTLVFDFERNQIFINVGTTLGPLPLTIEKQIANVLFFRLPGGRTQSVRYISSNIISLSIEDIKKPNTLYRWHEDGKLKEKINGAWTTDKGTAVFDFKNNEYTVVIGVNVIKHQLNDVLVFINAIFYKLDDEDIQRSVHLITPNILHMSDDRAPFKYGTLYRWHENR